MYVKNKKNNCLSQKIIYGTLTEIRQNVKLFGSRSGPMFCRCYWSFDLYVCLIKLIFGFICMYVKIQKMKLTFSKTLWSSSGTKSIKRLGFRSGPTFCRSWFGFKPGGSSWCLNLYVCIVKLIFILKVYVQCMCVKNIEDEIDFFKKIILEHYQLERQMIQMEILLALIWVQTDLGSSCFQVSTDNKSCL